MKTMRRGGEELVIIWPIDAACGIGYHEVFAKDMFSDIKTKIIEVYVICHADKGIMYNIKRKEYKKALSCVPDTSKLLFNRKIRLPYLRFGKRYYNYSPSQEIWSSETRRKQYLDNTWNSVKRALHEKEPIYIRAFCGIIQDQEAESVNYSVIKFREEYWERVNNILPANEKYVGIHIRRTDHLAAIEKSSTEAFLKMIDKIICEAPQTKFFLATDDFNEERRLRTLYGNRLIVQLHKEWGRMNREQMTSGIIDFLCLLRCEYILGSHSSVFSYFAAKFGDKELIVCEDK